MKIINWSSLSFKSIRSIKSALMPYITNLQQREKLAIAIAGGALLVFLILQLLIFPTLDRRTRLRKAIDQKTEDLREIHEVRAEYRSLSQNTSSMESRLKRRPKTFTLFSFIDRLAGKSQLKANIAYMKPSTTNIKNSPLRLSTVEMKLNSLTMAQLAAFLHGVEDKNNAVWLRRITISKGDKSDALLNAVLQVETFQR